MTAFGRVLPKGVVGADASARCRKFLHWRLTDRGPGPCALMARSSLFSALKTFAPRSAKTGSGGSQRFSLRALAAAERARAVERTPLRHEEKPSGGFASRFRFLAAAFHNPSHKFQLLAACRGRRSCGLCETSLFFEPLAPELRRTATWGQSRALAVLRRIPSNRPAYRKVPLGSAESPVAAWFRGSAGPSIPPLVPSLR